MSFPEITARALVGSALAIATPPAANSSTNTYELPAVTTNRPGLMSEHLAIRSHNSGATISCIDADAWSAKKNIRFKELARDEALRELSIQELAELDSLTKLRRFAKYPRSAEEILWQRRQETLTRTLVQALEDYVEFHEATN